MKCVSVMRLSPIRTPPPLFPSGKKLYPYCLVPVGSRNGFEHDSHNKNNCLFHKQAIIDLYIYIYLQNPYRKVVNGLWCIINT